MNVDPMSIMAPSPYRKLKDYWKERFGGRMQKVSLHAGMTCPNRDGTLGIGGCLYCSNEAFTPAYCHEEADLTAQIEQGYAFMKGRYPRAVGFLGYLQAYTNTYGPMDELIGIYETILAHPRMNGLVIGTRPDCLPDSLLEWLVEAAEQKPVYIELGIESFVNETLYSMNRGHTIEQAEETVDRVAATGLPVGGHFLVGFPGEPWTYFFDQVDRLNRLPLHSVKVHQLHVFKDTPLADCYRKHPEQFSFPPKEDYMEQVITWLSRLRPDMYVDRVFGDAPFKFILNPTWGVRLEVLVRELDVGMLQRNIVQGERYVRHGSQK